MKRLFALLHNMVFVQLLHKQCFEILSSVIVGGFLISSTNMRAQPACAWVSSHAGTNAVHTYCDTPVQLVVDRAGDVLVLGGGADMAGPASSYLLLKYSNAGIPLWTNYYWGRYPYYSTKLTSLVVDSNRNAFIGGYSEGGAATIKISADGVSDWTNVFGASPTGFAATAVMAMTGSDVVIAGQVQLTTIKRIFFTLKYDSRGTPIWTNYYSRGNEESIVTSLATDSSGNVHVTGRSSGSTGADFVTIKYATDGLPIWTNLYTSPGIYDDIPSKIIVDKSGGVYVTGTAPGYNVGGMTTIKYNPNGTRRWIARYTSTNHIRVVSMVVDNRSNVLVVAASHISPTGYEVPLIMKYSANGLPQWTNQFSLVTSESRAPTDATLDSAGNLYITGRALNTPEDSSMQIIKVRPDGSVAWSFCYNHPPSYLSFDSDVAISLALDGETNIFATGIVGLPTGHDDIITFKLVQRAQPKILPPTLMNQRKFGFNFLSETGQVYNIEYSTNLKQWNVLTNVSAVGGVIQVQDGSGPASGTRFYRVGVQ